MQNAPGLPQFGIRDFAKADILNRSYSYMKACFLREFAGCSVGLEKRWEGFSALEKEKITHY